jgi:hypothetical protein
MSLRRRVIFLAADRGLVFCVANSVTDEGTTNDPDACCAWYELYLIEPILWTWHLTRVACSSGRFSP